MDDDLETIEIIRDGWETIRRELSGTDIPQKSIHVIQDVYMEMCRRWLVAEVYFDRFNAEIEAAKKPLTLAGFREMIDAINRKMPPEWLEE